MKSNENPYKKNYCTQTYSKSINKNTKLNKKDIIKLNKELRDIAKEQNSIYNKKNKNSKKQFKCNKCKISYNNIVSLEKHKPIHLNPVYCPFKNCNKMFSPKHKYQYKQHIDGHNGGLHIQCKFCEHTSKTLTSNTVHMKSKHSQQYNHYMKEIEEANKDTQPLNSKNIINLTTKYINTHIMDDLDEDTNTNNNWYSYQYEDDNEEEDEDDEYEDDENEEYDNELINIELNKYNFYYYENNLDFLSTIAILDAYKKI
jgi:hypothetical protein